MKQLSLQKWLCPALAMLAMTASVCLTSQSASGLENDNIDEAIRAIQKVDSKGNGHEAAIKAMATLNQCKIDQVPRLLAAMDNANPLGQNWLRAAINSAVNRGGELPADQIRKYFNERNGSHLGRLLAFELLTKDNESLSKVLTPKLIDDPSLPLRRKGIKWLISKSEESDHIQALGMLGLAIEKARDVDQVQQLQGLLSKKGIQIDLTKQLGYAAEWQLVGPFDNKDQKGFSVAYGPEKNLDAIDTKAEYADAMDKENPANWTEHLTSDAMGVVDLNKAVGKVKGAIVYGYTEFESGEDRDAEIRIGCINANKVWVNGELVISNEVYHVGMMPDQFKGKVKLKKGANKILFKVCQNEQTQPWAQRWQFQLRVCDSTGKAIAPADAEAESNE